MSDSFQDLLLSFAPWWLRNRVAGTFLETVGATIDSAQESFIQGLHAADPLQCPEDALPQLSEDRGIRLFPTEPTESKRLRLSRWRQLQKRRGTHKGELQYLQPYFLPAGLPLMRIVHQSNEGTPRAMWHTIDAGGTYTTHIEDPSNWDFDGQPEKKRRWWAIVYTHALNYAAPFEYDDGTLWDDGQLWDGDPTAVQAADIVAILLDWKSAHSKLWGVITTDEPTAFDPTAAATVGPDGWTSHPVGNWAYVIDPVTGDPTRPPYASFVYDLAPNG